MSVSGRKSGGGGTKLWLAGGAAILVVSLAAFVVQRSGTVEGNISGLPTFEVVEGPLLISVTESGTINAREQVVIKSEVEGQTQILFLVPEGEQVRKGELLVRLDSSKLDDQLVDEQIRVQNTEASFIDARESLAVVKSQAESDVTAAELAFQFAGEDLDKYVDGDFPMQLKDAQARVTLAEASLASAEEDLRGKQRLFDKDFITAKELDTSKRFLQGSQLELELSNSNMELLKGFTYARAMTQLRSDLEEAELALERAKLKASADIVQAEANYKARDSEYRRQQSKLDKVVRQIKNTEIYAPMDGMVVYATTSRGRGPMSSQEPLEEGQMVRERQEIIHLPTASSVMAKVPIHESNLSKVRPGLGVRITVDALPDRVFTGYIARIAQLPDAQSIFMNPDLKVYDSEIYIDGDGSHLRTGMSCQAEIIIEQYDKATYVPVQAVVLVKGKPMVQVVNGNRIEDRMVEVGLDNNRMIRIAANLEPGERVLLTPEAPERSEDEVTDLSDSFVEPSAEPIVGRSEVFPPEQRRGDWGRGMENMSPGQREEMRKRYENMSPEDRERGRGSGGAGGMRGGGMRGGMGNMSPEQMEEMRKRFESMSPEEQERMRQRMRSGGGFGGSSPHGN